MVSFANSRSLKMASLSRCRCMNRLTNLRELRVTLANAKTKRSYCVEASLPPPTYDGAQKLHSEKISAIVESISKLTLTEVADLNQLLKTTLNIADAPMMAAGTLSAPSAAPVEEEQAPEEEQTEFTVRLVQFNADSKLKVIKELKKILTSLNVVQVKKFIESVPQPVKEKIPKAEAEEIKKALEAVGGSVEIE